MGSTHARVIAESSVADLDVVIDVDPEAAKRVAGMYETVPSTNLADAFDCDGVIIAGSTAARMECVLPLLEAGLPMLVEKPFAPTLAELDRLLDISERRDIPVMCGFVERFNAAFLTALQTLDGPVTHLLATRHSPPATRMTSSVVNDLMLHDLDIAQRVFGDIEGVLVGSACLRPPSSSWNEIADCTIAYGQQGVATLSASRMSQRKVRSLTIQTATKVVEVDLLRHHGEPLALQLEHFVDLIDGVADPDEERRQIRPAHALAEQIEMASQRS